MKWMTQRYLKPTMRQALDLHVLGAPLAFTLSQDQTLQKDLKECQGSWLSQDPCPPKRGAHRRETLQMKRAKKL